MRYSSKDIDWGFWDQNLNHGQPRLSFEAKSPQVSKREVVQRIRRVERGHGLKGLW
jgi:hypothetical protein